MSGGGSQSTTTRAEYPNEVKQYVGPAFDMFANQTLGGGTPMPLYGGDRVADFTPEQQYAQAAQMARGQNGSPLNAAAGGYVSDVLGGKYLNAGNPYLQEMMQQAGQGVNAQMSSAGRYGSGAHTDQLVRSAFAPTLYNDYQNQMGRMDWAAGMAPTLAQEDYRDIAAMQGVGDARQRQAQTELEQNAIMPYEFASMWPQTQTSNFLNALSGLPMGQQSQIPQASIMQQGLGAGIGLLGSYFAGGGSF